MSLILISIYLFHTLFTPSSLFVSAQPTFSSTLNNEESIEPTAGPTARRSPTDFPTVQPTESPEFIMLFSTTEVDDTCCSCTERSFEAGCSSDPVCEDTICSTVDFRCCTRRWRTNCVYAAEIICGDLDTCCGCLNVNNNNPECENDIECSNTICETDPFCCNNEWDNICVTQARAVCNGEEIPTCCSCTSIDHNDGCTTDTECEAGICSLDPFCCGNDHFGQGFWDQVCVNFALSVCRGFNELPESEGIDGYHGYYDSYFLPLREE